MDLIYIKKIRQEIKKLKITKFGVSIPELRKLAKKIAKENYKKFLENNTFETFELKLLYAFVLGYAKDDIKILIKYFDKFVPYVDDWAVNDSLCQSFKITRIYPEFVWNYLMKFKKSTKEFEIRILAVMLLSHYLTDKYIDRVIEILDKVNINDYYSQMGVAWAFAEITGKYPNKGLFYLKNSNCNLNKITYKKTLQKIKESFKISDEIKENLKFFETGKCIHV